MGSAMMILGTSCCRASISATVREVTGPPSCVPPIIFPRPALIRMLEELNIRSMLIMIFFSVPLPKEKTRISAATPITMPIIMKKERSLWLAMIRKLLLTIMFFFIFHLVFRE